MKTFAQLVETEGDVARSLLSVHDERKLCDLLAYSGAETVADLLPVIEEDDRLRAKILGDAHKVFAQLRAYLICTYGDVPVCRRNFMYELANSIGEHQSPLACDTPYPKDLGDFGNIRTFMRACDRELLIRSYMLIPRHRMPETPITAYEYDHIEGNLRSILRVCHILERGGAALSGFAVGNVHGSGEHCIINGQVDDTLEGNLANIARHLR